MSKIKPPIDPRRLELWRRSSDSAPDANEAASEAAADFATTDGAADASQTGGPDTQQTGGSDTEHRWRNFKLPTVELPPGLRADRPLGSMIPAFGTVTDSPLEPMNPDEATPVLCVHGTIGARENWTDTAHYLQRDADGRARRVFFAAHGNQGTAPLTNSVDDVSRVIESIHSHTGCTELVMIGHSRGGLVSLLTAARFPELISHVVGVGANFSGAPRWKILPDPEVSEVTGVTRAVGKVSTRLARHLVGDAGSDQFSDSPMLLSMLETVNPETPVTAIASTTDRIVPPDYAFNAPVKHLRRVLVQNEYPQARVFHNMLLHDPRANSLIARAVNQGPPEESSDNSPNI